MEGLRTIRTSKKEQDNWEKELPEDAYSYLKTMTLTIETTDIYQIHQIYMFKEGSSTANDYVCIVLKVMPKELIAFFGGEYLFQVWKNKSRLFQHSHSSAPSVLYGNNTELAYLPEGENQSIIIVRPYISKVLKVKNPYVQSDGVQLFIDDEKLLITKENKIIKMDIEQIRKLNEASTNDSPFVGQENEFDQLIDLNDRGKLHSIRQRPSDISLNQRKRNTVDIREIINSLNKEETEDESDSLIIQYDTTYIQEDHKIVGIDYDYEFGHNILIYVVPQNRIELIIYQFEINEENQMKAWQLKTQTFGQIQSSNDEISKIKCLKKSDKTYIMMIITANGHAILLKNMEFQSTTIKNSTLSLFEKPPYLDYFIGFEGIYLKHAIENESPQEFKSCVDLEKEEYENYFGIQGNEIKSVNFMNLNKSQVIDILVEYEGNYMLKLVLYAQDFGECDMTILFQGQLTDQKDKSALYASNGDSHIIKIVSSMSSKYRLISVPYAPPNAIFLANTETNDLHTYCLKNVSQVLDEEELELCLTQKLKDFDYDPSYTYYFEDQYFYYLHKGNIVEYDLINGQKFIYDMYGNIKRFIMIEGKSVYLRCKSDHLYFFDLDWIQTKEFIEMKKNAKILPVKSEYASLIWTPVLRCESILISRFQFDIISNKLVSFSNPWTIQIFNPMNNSKVDIVGTYNYFSKFAAHNVIRPSPSNFTDKLVSLDKTRNEIKIWSASTGMLQQVNKLKDQDFTGFKYYMQYEDLNLIHKKISDDPKDNRYLWRQVKVCEKHVDIRCQFVLEYYRNYKYYVSCDHKLILVFQGKCQSVELYQIHQEAIEAQLLISFKVHFVLFMCPFYFSPDFSMFFDRDYPSKNLKIYQLKKDDQGNYTGKQYEEIQTTFDYNVDQIQICLYTGYPICYFESNYRIAMVNKDLQLQSFPIYQDFKRNKSLVYEIGCQDNKLIDALIARHTGKDRIMSALNSEEAIKMKIELLRADIISKNRFGRILFDCDIFQRDNIRSIQSFTFYHWRVIDLLENGKIGIESLKPQIIEELLNIVLPCGDTMIHRLIKSNIQQFEKLLQIIENERIENKHEINIHFLPDLKGVTPLHLCIKNSYSKAAGAILLEIGKNPVDDHITFIKNTFADLLMIAPVAFGEYLDMRIKKPEWAPTYTNGPLKQPRGCDFAVIPSNLCPDQEQLSEQLFEKSEDQEIRMPLICQVADFPKMHHFNDPDAQNFLKQLSSSSDIESFFGRKYIQAMLEIKLPYIRQAIIKKLVIPYMIYLTLFSIQSLHLAFMEDTVSLIFSIIIQMILLAFTAYFLRNIRKQFSNMNTNIFTCDMWNYFDIFPKFLVVISVILQLIDATEVVNLMDEINIVNSFSAFILWLNLLYFCRIFRRTGHLIQMIIEVARDMKFFMGIVLLTIFSFSSAFLILSKNNKPEDQFIDNYLHANTFVYNLLLGDFDTTNFGTRYIPVVWFFFLLSTMFLIVIMLNLLIAIISDTFERVQGQAKQRMYKEFASLIVENIHLLSDEEKADFDQQGDYLYIAQLEQDECNNSDMWEGKLNDLRKTIIKKCEHINQAINHNHRFQTQLSLKDQKDRVQSMNDAVQNVQKSLDQQIDSRFNAFGDNNSLKMKNLESKLDRVTQQMEQTMLLIQDMQKESKKGKKEQDGLFKSLSQVKTTK